MIRKRKGKWYVISESGKRLGGPYGSKGQAVRRFAQNRIKRTLDGVVVEVQDSEDAYMLGQKTSQLKELKGARR